MIPALIIWLLKKYKEAGNRKQFIRNIATAINPELFRIAGVLLALLITFVTISSFAQTKELNYEILRGGAVVGNIHFSEKDNSGNKQMSMVSLVKGRILFITYTGNAQEEAFYQNGVLYYSSIYRKMNGKEKANKQHQAINNQYIIRSGDNSETSSNYPITYNMLSLYSTEPVNINKVYSDNFQRFLEIKNMGNHKYKISLPDGNTNYYYYQNAVLVLVEAFSTWYSVKITLKK